MNVEVLKKAARRTDEYLMQYGVELTWSLHVLGLKVDWLRRQLQRLEKEGRVRRAPTHYARQICWALPDEA